MLLGADKLHVIGHSLGAHVSGFIGKKYQELTGSKLPRITGKIVKLSCLYTKIFNTGSPTDNETFHTTKQTVLRRISFSSWFLTYLNLCTPQNFTETSFKSIYKVIF